MLPAGCDPCSREPVRAAGAANSAAAVQVDRGFAAEISAGRGLEGQINARDLVQHSSGQALRVGFGDASTARPLPRAGAAARPLNRAGDCAWLHGGRRGNLKSLL